MTTNHMSGVGVLLAPARLANLTPHPLHLIDTAGKQHELASIGEARATSALQTSYGTLELIDSGAPHISLTSPQRFVGVTVPPFDREAYTGVVVSMATAQTLEATGPPAADTDGTPITRRLTVYTPGALVRDSAGVIRGAAALEWYSVKL